MSRSSSLWGSNVITYEDSSSSTENQSSSSSSSFVENHPYIVQTSQYQTQIPLVTSIPFSLSDSPEIGNVLITFLGVNQYLQSRTPTPPDDTWNLIHNSAYLQAGLYAYWKVVKQGDGQNYTFSISGTNEYHSGVIYEIGGCETENPIDKQSVVTRATAISAATNSVTPSINGTLPLSAVVTVVGQTNGTTVNSLSSGWSAGPNGYSTWEATWSAKKGLTTDTVTSISNTFTFNIATMGAVASILLIAPKEFMSSSSSSVDSSSSSNVVSSSSSSS